MTGPLQLDQSGNIDSIDGKTTLDGGTAIGRNASPDRPARFVMVVSTATTPIPVAEASGPWAKACTNPVLLMSTMGPTAKIPKFPPKTLPLLGPPKTLPLLLIEIVSFTPKMLS